MHKEILTQEQLDLLPLVKEFGKEFVLVGGTAVALHIGHRRSIDFNLFSYNNFDNGKIKRKISCFLKIEKTNVSEAGEYTIQVKKVKITFYQYPYKIKSPARLDKIISMPNLLTLAAMKAYALGRRSKWKDYVDLYFILNSYHSLKEISEEGSRIFGGEFNAKIFREALAYFNDVNYSEGIVYLKGYKVSDAAIKKALIDFSLEK